MSPFHTDGFPARWYCGEWPEWLGWTHIISDAVIFVSYQLIPVVALLYIFRKKKVIFPPLFWLFAAFISFCGIGHLLEAIIFWHPVYPLAGYVKVLTATVSAVTAFYCIRLMPKTLDLPSVVESESRHKHLFNSIPMSILEVDSNGTITLVNKETEKFFKYTNFELVGKNISTLIPERLREDLEKHFSAYCKSPYEIKLEGKELLAKDSEGNEYYVEISIAPSLDNKTLICSILDINSRTLSQKELQSKNKEINSLFSLGLIGLIRANLSGEIMEVNEYYCDLIGYSEKEILQGLKWDEITPKECLDKEKKILKELENSDTVGPYEKQYIKKDGSVVDLLIGVHITNRDKGDTICFALDITDLKNKQRDLSEAKEKLSKALKLQKVNQKEIENYLTELERVNEEKDDFIYTASHDLKEPLRAIHGLSTMLIHKIENNKADDTPKVLKDISDLSKRSRNQIDSLLSYSTIGSEKLNISTFNLPELVQEVISIFKYATEESGAKINIENIPEMMTADRDLMTKVFENLISNALKYCKNNPIVTISSEKREDETYYVISDNGIGIPPEKQELVFKIFKSLNKNNGSSGVGLTIVKKVIQLHKGKVFMESDTDKGTKIYFSIGDIL